MKSKDIILKFAADDEEKLFLSKIYDKVKTSYYKNYTTYSSFLNLREQDLVSRAFSNMLVINNYGGFKEAERKISAFSSNQIENIAYPIDVLKIETSETKNLSHRDFLGSILGLGLKREKIGDIVLFDSYAIVFVADDISEYIRLNLKKVGNKNIEIDYFNEEEITDNKKFELINATVSSLRVDCVSALAFKKSRTQMSEHIKSKRLAVNFQEIDSVDLILSKGDNLSAKGFGRAILEDIKGVSKKGKHIITIKKFI